MILGLIYAHLLFLSFQSTNFSPAGGAIRMEAQALLCLQEASEAGG